MNEVKNNTQNVSQESDVYSFGILLFELLTRKPSVQVLGGPDAVDLVKLMKSVKSMNMTSKVFDAYLLGDPTIRERMVRVLQIGISCVVKSMKKRPKMSEVAKMLEDLYVDDVKGLVFVNHNDALLSGDPFDLEDLLRASAEVLGKGTFGTSYKADLENGILARVKRLNHVNVTSKEFKQHMKVIGRIKHKNCAKLIAYYFSKDKVFLVYDHYNHDNLSVLLHGTKKPLSWNARFKIALTLAKGIAHIHRLDGPNLVHGNLSSSNIFVSRDNNAIITDTALWKVTKPIGYFVLRHQGYIAPEVKDTRNMSRASDVYSFGVVLLELLTRRSPQETGSEDEATSLVKLVCDSDASLVLDIELMGYDATDEVLRLAKDCVEDAPELRPMMHVVVKRLEEISSGIYKEESEPSMWIGSRLEDALEVQLTRLTIVQHKAR